MKEFNYQLTKSPAFFQDHRESPHSDHSYTLPEGDAKLSLNGDWYFH